MLGIPCVVDRLIQQAVLQVLTPIFDPTFSDASYGFRKGRGTLDAVKRAREHVESGRRWTIDLDLEKFFDQVNHDILMSRVARRVKDKHVLLLIRRYLQAGIMEDGVVSPRREGTPQGSPLSPLLSNILLDELDKELESRGHAFVRYADDVSVFVFSEKAGIRVMDSIDRFLRAKLRLRLNRDKSAVGRPWKRQILGYTMTSNLKPRLKISGKASKRLKDKLRPVFRRARGSDLGTTIRHLRRQLIGWMSYYQLVTVKAQLEQLDAWIRRKLRVVLWRHWKKPRTRFKKLKAAGVNPAKAGRAAWGMGPWASSATSAMNVAIPNAAFADLGLPSLKDLQTRYANRH